MKKLKILHLFNQYLPQTENWCFKLISHTPGTEVYIGAREYLKNNFYHPEFHYAEHPFGALEAYNAHLSKNCPGQFLQKLTLKVLQATLGDSRKAISTFGQTHDVDLVHAHFADVGWYFRKLPRRLNTPFVLSFYGWDYECLPTIRPAYRGHYQQLFQRVDAVVCEGQHGAEILAKMGCPEKKLKVVPLGVEPQKIPLAERSKVAGELHLLQIATFNEKKGHLYGVKAFAQALQNSPNMTLTLVGGPGQPGVQQVVYDFIKKNSLTEQVTIYEAIDYAQLYSFLGQYQVFIHPSCYAQNRDCEGGAPIVLLDAQATGMPVIATHHCDIPSEVIDGQTGLLAREKDVDQLSQHIQRFYHMDDEEYQTFCQNARKQVERHFDIRHNALLLRKVYNDLLEKPR